MCRNGPADADNCPPRCTGERWAVATKFGHEVLALLEALGPAASTVETIVPDDVYFALVQKSRAYAVPTPGKYMTAVGALVANWSFLKWRFGGLPQTFCAGYPAASKLKVAKSFSEKTCRIQSAANSAFQSCPTLAAKIVDFLTRVCDAADKRTL
jgi:hypothetical protein